MKCWEDGERWKDKRFWIGERRWEKRRFFSPNAIKSIKSKKAAGTGPRRLSVSKKFDTLPGGIQYPLDTPQVPDETSGDTPGFAPRWARVVV